MDLQRLDIGPAELRLIDTKWTFGKLSRLCPNQFKEERETFQSIKTSTFITSLSNYPLQTVPKGYTIEAHKQRTHMKETILDYLTAALIAVVMLISTMEYFNVLAVS